MGVEGDIQFVGAAQLLLWTFVLYRLLPVQEISSTSAAKYTLECQLHTTKGDEHTAKQFVQWLKVAHFCACFKKRRNRTARSQESVTTAFKIQRKVIINLCQMKLMKVVVLTSDVSEMLFADIV